MSVRVMAEVWEHSEFKGAPLLTLLALADIADDEGAAWPSHELLAGKTRMSRRQIARILTALTASGEVEIVRKGGRHGSTRYRIPVDTLAAKPGSWRDQIAGQIEPVHVTQLRHRNHQEPSVRTFAPRSGAEERPRDVVWDALTDLLGETTNAQARGKRNRAAKLIKESLAAGERQPADFPAEIRRRASAYIRTWPNVSLTDTALATHWDELAPPPRKASTSPPCPACGVGGGQHADDCPQKPHEPPTPSGPDAEAAASARRLAESIWKEKP